MGKKEVGVGAIWLLLDICTHTPHHSGQDGYLVFEEDEELDQSFT